MHPAFTRTALIGVMLGGGLLCAGISQAQDTDAQVERSSELVAASGGPASTAHLIRFARDAAAVDVREDDVADSPAAPASGVAALAEPTSSAQDPGAARQVAAARPAAGRN